MRRVQVVIDPDDLSLQAASIITESARESFDARGCFRLCLAGGSTPRMVYRRLAEPGVLKIFAGQKLILYWGDERCVPPDDPHSNYRMAHEEWIQYLPTAEVSIHRMQGELDPAQSAAQYEKILRSHFPRSQEPTFDLLLLGMGDDGHTASLFPHTPAVDEAERWVLGYFVPQLASWRLTLTPPVLNRARKTLFLVAGGSKAGSLSQVLSGKYRPQEYPAQIIQSNFGDTLWLADRTAAAAIPGLFND